jgi:hypothetical protein
LFADVRTGNQQRVENAVYAFVSLGVDEVISELKRILNDHGHKDMAEVYLNCGENRLARAAKSWASAHGYSISKRVGSTRIAWGAW